jgi:hypothetical protein
MYKVRAAHQRKVILKHRVILKIRVIRKINRNRAIRRDKVIHRRRGHRVREHKGRAVLVGRMWDRMERRRRRVKDQRRT